MYVKWERLILLQLIEKENWFPEASYNKKDKPIAFSIGKYLD